MSQTTTSQLSFSDGMIRDHHALHSLDGVTAVLDWSAIEGLLSPIYSSRSGRPSYPLVTLFRSLLLGCWYRLSDVQLEAQLARDLVFRKFVLLGLNEGTPDHSTLSRFRQQLEAHALWEKLLAEVNRQLTAQHIIMQWGQVSIIDASVIEAHQSGPGKRKDGSATRDPEAGWNVKQNTRGKKTSTYGYSFHSNVDEDGFILGYDMTPGNVHDSQRFEELFTGEEAAVYADSAYASRATEKKLAARGIRNHVQRKGYRNHPISDTDRERNKEIGVTRSVVERVFGTLKRHYGMGRTRFLGLLRNTVHCGLLAIAYNVRKGAHFVQQYGVVGA
ncbi:MAG: IS5 family transposase [Deltaproteobacteria bacterium]|nr:IS5 family transposase [Deltaproteobacteria bacterium]